MFKYMEYLQNNLCKFKPLFNINYNIKKNLICCCIFKMSNKGYKEFSIYLNGLYKMYKYVINNLKNYRIRLFIDNSIYKDKNIMDILNKMVKIEIVLYECKELLLKNNKNFHEGLFGTLIRFFPMFDFPNNDANIVLITDVDDFSFNKVLNTIDIMKKNNKIKNIYVLKLGNISKNVKYKYFSYKNIITPYCIAQSIVSFLKINHNVIIDFINKVKKSNKIYSYYYEMLKDNKLSNGSLQKFIKNTNFIYGIDEYFINKTLTDYLIDNKLPFANDIKFEVLSLFYYILSDDLYKTPEQIKLLNELIDKILKTININKIKNISLKNKYQIINDISYKHNKKELYIQLNEIMYEELIKNYKKDEYRFLFPKYFYRFLFSKKLFCVYKFHMIVYYYINYSDIVIDKEIFNKNIISHLHILKNQYCNNINNHNNINNIIINHH